jgi:hypothetical protein
MKTPTSQSYLFAGAGAAGLVLVGVILMLAARPAAATPQFAKDTGKACGVCHTSAAGGGPLTPFGEKFHANGDKLP